MRRDIEASQVNGMVAEDTKQSELILLVNAASSPWSNSKRDTKEGTADTSLSGEAPTVVMVSLIGGPCVEPRWLRWL